MEVRGVDFGGGIGDGFVGGFVDDGGGVVCLISRGFNIESVRNNYQL